MCFESGGVRVGADLLDVKLLQILRLVEEVDEALRCLAADDALVHIVEVQDGAIFGVLDDMEVSEVAEHVSNILGGEIGALAFLELDMKDIFVLLLQVKSSSVWLLGIHVVAGGARSSVLKHHHFVLILSEKLMLQIQWSPVQILRIQVTLGVVGLLPFAALGLLCIFVLPGLSINLIDLLELQNHCVAIASHVSIISSLMVMAQEIGALVIGEPICQVEIEFK